MKRTLFFISLILLLFISGCAMPMHDVPPGFRVYGTDKLKGVKFIPAVSESTARERNLYVGWIYFEPNITVALHKHKTSQERLVVLQGSAIMLGENGNVEYKPGDSITISPNTQHGLISGPAGTIVFQEYNPGDDGIRFYNFSHIDHRHSNENRN